jgi:hypothetical protein
MPYSLDLNKKVDPPLNATTSHLLNVNKRPIGVATRSEGRQKVEPRTSTLRRTINLKDVHAAAAGALMSMVIARHGGSLVITAAS